MSYRTRRRRKGRIPAQKIALWSIGLLVALSILIVFWPAVLFAGILWAGLYRFFPAIPKRHLYAGVAFGLVAGGMMLGNAISSARSDERNASRSHTPNVMQLNTGDAYWDSLTPAEREVEARRRAEQQKAMATKVRREDAQVAEFLRQQANDAAFAQKVAELEALRYQMHRVPPRHVAPDLH